MKSTAIRIQATVSIIVASAAVLILLAAGEAAARVVRVEITSREVADVPLEEGGSGRYEVIQGIIHLEVDPDDPANGLITDLKLAGRNRRGGVEFSTEFELHKPVDAGRGNRRLIYFVNNRGSKLGSGHFSHGYGRNWLYSKGWSYLWCGWNCDVPDSDRKLNITVPVATDGGGTITGEIYTEIISFDNAVVYSRPLVWGGSVACPPVDMNDPGARLTVRRYRWEEPVEVPRDKWSFARYESGGPVPDPGFLYVEDGIKPGFLYDLVYTGRDPRLTGLGLAAIRDVVSFFRFEASDEAGLANPLAGAVDHAYAWGHSQSARLLYHFAHQDFNGDEEGRMVFDGLIANCGGGGRGLFNSRFAQTTRHGSHHEDNLYPIDCFPFNTVEQLDPVTGERGDGLARAKESGFLPKVMFINSATDYWTRAASLLHTDVEGKNDAAIDPNVRIYMVAGRAHTDGRIGIVGRALLTALDRWVSDDVDPPPSEVPRISDGTLVDLESFKEVFPRIPGAFIPPSFYHPYRLDPGPRWRTEGIADYVPPKTGPRYVCLVPQVDADGNDLAGIRLPEIAVPLATFTGWSMRNPFFSATLQRNAGRVWPLSLDEDERAKSNDPRVSIRERYPNGADYLRRVDACLADLNRRGFLLDEDVEMLRDQAGVQADWMENPRTIEDVTAEEGAEAGVAYFGRLSDAGLRWWFGSGDGRIFNRVTAKAYGLMSEGANGSALELFRLITLLFAGEWKAWDGLAECYYRMEAYDSSMTCCRKSLELNPGNENAARMLAEMESKGKR